MPKGTETTGSIIVHPDVPRLPEHLTVGHTLFLGQSCIPLLPQPLSVQGDLRLKGSQIQALPVGLQVRGSLDLYGTPITELPEGLKVAGSLDLRETGIRDLPADWQVSGSMRLHLPVGMLDIGAFMADRTGDEFVRVLPTSGHRRMEMIRRLQRFPALLRLVLGMGAYQRLRITRTRPGAWEAVVETVFNFSDSDIPF